MAQVNEPAQGAELRWNGGDEFIALVNKYTEVGKSGATHEIRCIQNYQLRRPLAHSREDGITSDQLVWVERSPLRRQLRP